MDANEIIWTTFYTINTILAKWYNWPDALALYFKYIEQTRIQQTNITWSLDVFMKKKMWRWDSRFKKAKKILRDLWSIDLIQKRDSLWRVKTVYVKVNFLINENKIRKNSMTYEIEPSSTETHSVDIPPNGEWERNALSIKHKCLNNITNSSKEEEQSSNFWKTYINDFIASVEAVYEANGIICDLSNRKYAKHRVGDKGYAKTKLKVIKKLWFTDPLEFIDHVLKSAKSIKFWNHVWKITNLYSLRKNYASILNIAKKDLNSAAEKLPKTFEEMRLEIESLSWKIALLDEKNKYEKVLWIVKFIRSMNPEEQGKRRELMVKAKWIFGKEIYKTARDATAKKIILPRKN